VTGSPCRTGSRVYPDDVESALTAEPAIKAAVVLEHGTGRIAAILLPAEPDLEEEALRAILDGVVESANRRLAPHQRVRRWWRWPEADLPRTHTLKIRRAKVAAWLAMEAPLSEDGTPLSRAGGDGPRSTASAMAHISAAEAAPAAAAPAAGAAPVAHQGSTVTGPRSALSIIDGEAAVIDAVRATLVRTHGQAPAGLGPATRLDTLGLDSLALVALALDLEERLDASIEVDELVASADLAAFAELALNRRGVVATADDPSRWAFSRPAVLARAALGALAIRPVLRLIAHPRVEGREHLRGLAEPVLICGNHTSHLDAPSILAALPGRVRSRTTVAAAADYFFDGGPLGPLTALAFATFPFGRSERVRESLDRVADFLADGWNVVLFPEGGRSVSGAAMPFKEGIGLMAADMGATVLPVHIDGAHAILPKGARLPRRHAGVTVRFGPPIAVPPGTSIADATAAVEAAVRALGSGAA